MSDELDVIVIGAGLAGLYCARDLARQGLRVAIADRKIDPGDKVQTTGIFVRKTFVETDLPHAFLGNPLRRVRLHGPRGAELALESDKDEFRIGQMPGLYRHLLRQAVEAGAEWMPRTTFESSFPAMEGSVVVIRSGGLRRELHTRFVVGADGARSQVARDLGLDVNARFLVGVEDVFDARDGRAIDALHCFLDGELAPGYIAWIAGDAHETHLGVAGEAGQYDPNEALERFRALVAAKFGIDGDTRRERRGGLIPVNGILRRISCAHGLLIGDAAGAVSPLTAGGLDACIRLSRAAARVLTEAVRRNDSSLLAEFDGEQFRGRFVSRLWMRRALSSLRSAFILDAAVRAAAFPLFRALARHVFFGRGSFPDVRFAFEKATKPVVA